MNAGESTPPIESNPLVETPTVPGNSTALKRKDVHAGGDDDADDENERDNDEGSQSGILDKKLDDEGVQLCEERKKQLYEASNTESLTFLEKMSNLPSQWPGQKESGLESHKRVIEELTKTPYLANCLQRHLNDAKQILSTGMDSYQPTPEEESIFKIFDEVPDVSERDKVKQQYFEGIIRSHCLEIRGHCLDIVRRVRDETVKVHTQLLVLSGLSQAEGTETRSTSKFSRTTIVDDDVVDRAHLTVAECQSIYSSIIHNAKDMDQVLPDVCLHSNGVETQNEAHEKMVRVAKTLEAFLSTAAVVVKTRNGQADKDKVLKGLAVLRSELMQPDDRNLQPSAAAAAVTEAAAASSNRGSSSVNVMDHRFIPGPDSLETAGAQPFIQLLFQAIGDCWNPDASSSSPAKSFIRKEVHIPETESRRKRKIDFLVQKERRWDAIIFDDNLTIPLEVKTLCRGERKGPVALLDEARDQVLSHLAKHLFIGFGFAQYGVPCHATGIIANMAAVQVFQLRYENVGSLKAKLQLYQTKLAPLMSRKTFKRWAASIKNKKRKDEVHKLEAALFGQDMPCGLDNEIPQGIQILFKLMKQPTGKKLHGISVETSSGNLLGDQLGTGATAVVFQHNGTDNVIKISRFGIKTYIDNELYILKELANGSEKCTNEHIPSIINNPAIRASLLSITLGSVSMTVRAIETSPVGKNVASVVLPTDTDATPDHGLLLVLEGIKSALDYMHAKRICHCDVTPKNIVIADKTNGVGKRAVLIDYSISSSSDTAFHAFHGTPNYVHRQIFLSALYGTKWNPRAEHDKAGLGFTLAFFANGCRRTWNVGDYPKKVKEPKKHEDDLITVMNTRLETAKAAVNMSRIANPDIKRQITELLAFDQEEEAK